MPFELVELKKNQQLFFDILPKDWQDAIVPYWDDYKSTAKIFVFFEGTEIVAGGILFYTMPPDLIWNIKNLQPWFDKGYAYIGFLFVAEHKRHQKLGSLWIENLKSLMPNQKFWLVIEEESLGKFYEKHHFVKMQELQTPNDPEWLYVYQNNI